MKQKIILLLLVVLSFSFIDFSFAEQTSQCGLEYIAKWYEWKKKTKLPLKQRQIVDYFEKVNKLEAELVKIWYEGPATLNPKPSPDRAVGLIDGYINELKLLEIPEECQKHYEAAKSYFAIAREYQEARKKHKEKSEELAEINAKSLQYDTTMFSEFWRVLKEIGLYDNFINETIELGLASKEEVEKELAFYKEYAKNSPILCPVCNQEMKRVKILYEGDKDYARAAENIYGQNPFLNDYLLSSKRFNNCPGYGYMCSKCSEWYEEYASKDKIVLRKWGWGLTKTSYRENEADKK